MSGKKWWIGALAIVATAVCLAKIFHDQFGGRHHVNVEPFAALGSLVAEETTKVLGSRGRVLVLAVDTATYKIPTLDTLLTSFRKTLAGKGDFAVSGIQKFRVPATVFLALTDGALIPPSANLSGAQVAKVLAACSNGDAIVSFVGFPALQAGELGQIKDKGIKVVVVSERDPQVLSLVQSGAIQLAVVPRDQPTAGAMPAKSARELVSQKYEVLSSGK